MQLPHFELVQGFIVSQTMQRLSIQLQDLITCTRTDTEHLKALKAPHLNYDTIYNMIQYKETDGK